MRLDDTHFCARGQAKQKIWPLSVNPPPASTPQRSEGRVAPSIQTVIIDWKEAESPKNAIDGIDEMFCFLYRDFSRLAQGEGGFCA